MFRIRAYMTNTCLACFDLALTACSYIAVGWVEWSAAGVPADYPGLLTPEHAATLGFILAVWVALSSYFGMYHSRRLDSPFADLVILLKVSLASWVILQ